MSSISSTVIGTLLLVGRSGGYNDNVVAVGAQYERRGDAWPVRGLLGGKDLAGRFVLRLRTSRRRSPQPLAVEHLIVVGAGRIGSAPNRIPVSTRRRPHLCGACSALGVSAPTCFP